MRPKPSPRVVLLVLCLTASAPALFHASVLAGCLQPARDEAAADGDEAPRMPGPQRRAGALLARLLALPRSGAWLSSLAASGGGDEALAAIEKEMRAVMVDTEGHAHIVVHSAGSEIWTQDNDLQPPCLPSLVSTELLQLLYLWRVNGDPVHARTILLWSHDRLAWLRNAPWSDVFELGWGVVFSVTQATCELVATAPALPDEPLDSTEVFSMYRDLYGFDYFDCLHRFAGSFRGNGSSSAACEAAPATASNSQLWPHRRFAALAARLPAACGSVCRLAVAFARVAQLLLGRRTAATGQGPVCEGAHGRSLPRLSEDDKMLLEEAQAEVITLEPLFRHGRGEPSAAHFCRHVRAVPLLSLLSRAACVEEETVATPGHAAVEGFRFDPCTSECSLPHSPMDADDPATVSALDESAGVFGCQESVPGDVYVSGWPPWQRLTAAGALAMYTLVQTVGSLMDAFRVRWWAAHATLLGALRHGGLLPQECDADFAVWRPDAHALVTPEFRAALAFAGVQAFQLPHYLTFRFCFAHIPLEGDARSVDGFVSCRLPYIDGHLADVVPHTTDRWNYIHRADTRYAQAFPLEGILRLAEGAGAARGEVAPGGDLRQRAKLGDHADVWVPAPATAHAYLTTLYGADWATALRQRDGPSDNDAGAPGLGSIVHNDSLTGGAAFRGLFARPSGPLRDVMAELRALGWRAPPVVGGGGL